jgi:membrane-bound metal-dependent hydrolase YbcI (DUF457 family)
MSRVGLPTPMNRRDHVLNALALGVGLGYLAQPGWDAGTARAVVEIAVPVVLGALFPDVDTAFGTHRKTLHNLPVLGLFLAYPLHFGNLRYVWIGVATHYVLDLLGTKRGLALLYPYEREFSLPVGVGVDSRLAGVVTLAVTAVELAAAAVVFADAPELAALAGL